MPWNQYMKVLILAVVILLSGGCGKIGSKPPPATTSPPPPTLINVEIVASTEVNPDNSGRPSPVVVRLYELKNLSAFNAADFFTLYQNDSAVLGGDLVRREEYVLRPGGQKIYRRKTSEETRYLAIIAAFRDIDQAAWKGSLPIPANRTTNITVHLNRLGLALEAQ